MNKLNDRLEILQGTASTTWQVSPGQVFTILADTELALKRATKRAATLPAEFERVEIVQAHGPTIEFAGRLLAETSFETRKGQPLEICLEIWETVGGALVAVSSSTLPGGSGREDCRVTVVEPSDDAQAMRFSIMDAFSWHDRARSMARKLGWSLRKDVE
jgi:hypothetical protein